MMRPRHPVPRYLAALVPALACALVSSTLVAQIQQGSIIGSIHVLRNNFPSSPVMVSLVAHGALVNSVYADNEGRFGFNFLEPNAYHVVIEEKEYEKVEETVVIDPISPVRVLSITLVPREAARTAPSPEISGGNPHLTNPAEYTKQIPKAARREFDKGVQSDREGKAEDAIRHYAKAIDLAPDFYAARNNLGSDFLAKSQFPEAQEQFEKVIRVNPSDAAAYFNLANAYLLQRRFPQAQEWLIQGLRREPDSGFGNFLQGSLYSDTGQPRAAEAALRRCLELDPIMAKAHLALANLYMQQQRNEDAASELRLFLRSFPEDPFAPKAKQVLGRLEGTDNKPNP